MKKILNKIEKILIQIAQIGLLVTLFGNFEDNPKKEQVGKRIFLSFIGLLFLGLLFFIIFLGLRGYLK